MWARNKTLELQNWRKWYFDLPFLKAHLVLAEAPAPSNIDAKSDQDVAETFQVSQVIVDRDDDPFETTETLQRLH